MILYTYAIVVENDTGSSQTYTILQERPHISPEISRLENTHSGTITMQAKAPNEQTVAFTLYRTYYAMCGSSQSGQIGDASVLVFGEKPVTLGTTSSDSPGSTVLVSAIDGTLQFDEMELPAGGFQNSFEIRTSNTFTSEEAKENKYMVGFGVSVSNTNEESNGPSSLFTPEPNKTYQINPSTVLYLTYGSYAKDGVIDISKAEKLLKINFDVTKERVTVIHDADNEPSIQT
ncbi:hypothetical protein OEA41_004560 [Lepraria neglecta]|uniref:Uncharacterized protein n=1 Tax=Lepraria neglecta TaxID=209136 RepID=A0AAE0DFZ5_9LECA|nr:hypothetical protein OEA41_004560 [Lepraria neglecta]